MVDPFTVIPFLCCRIDLGLSVFGLEWKWQGIFLWNQNTALAKLMNFVSSQFPITGDPFLLHLQYPCMGELADLGPTSLLLTLW